VVISTPYIERVTAFQTEDDSILIVHAHGVQPSQVISESVQLVAGRHSQILEARDGVDLSSGGSRSTVARGPAWPFCGAPDEIVGTARTGTCR